MKPTTSLWSTIQLLCRAVLWHKLRFYSLPSTGALEALGFSGGMTALHGAAMDGRVENSTILVEAVSNQSLRNTRGYTALGLAKALLGNVDILKVACKRGPAVARA